MYAMIKALRSTSSVVVVTVMSVDAAVPVEVEVVLAGVGIV